jgi:hypothetical protein
MAMNLQADGTQTQPKYTSDGAMFVRQRDTPVIPMVEADVTDAYTTLYTIDNSKDTYMCSITMVETANKAALYQVYAGNVNDVAKAKQLSGSDMPLTANGSENESISKGYAYIFVKAKNGVAGQAAHIKFYGTRTP